MVELNWMEAKYKMYDEIANLSINNIEKYIDFLCKMNKKDKTEKDLKEYKVFSNEMQEKFPETKQIALINEGELYGLAITKIVRIYFAIKKDSKLTVKELAEKMKKEEIEKHERAMKKMKEVMQTKEYKEYEKNFKKMMEKARKEDKEWQEKIKKGEEKFYLT